MQDTPHSPVPDLSVPVGSIVEWVAEWGAEVAAADIRAGRRRFADDLIAFGTHADVVVGRDAVEAGQWSQIWPAIEDFEFLLEDVRVRLSPDGLMAVAIVPWSSTGIDADGNRFDRPGRATIVLERDAVGGPWSGTHTHFSLARGVPSSTHGRREAIR
jgi:ketosteroid isomerase-like protein